VGSRAPRLACEHSSGGRGVTAVGRTVFRDSGIFRSATGVTAFCRIRSYLSTMQKQGHPMLSTLTDVFHSRPLPVAWEPE